MSAAHALEALLAGGALGLARALPWRAALGAGAAAGELVWRLGLRRRVAEDNLSRAFPDWNAARRDQVLREHYRELGRVAAEYARLPELTAAPAGEVIAEFRGMEHLEAVRCSGRPAIMMTGHLGNFELLGAVVGRIHPVDFLARPLTNRAIDARISHLRHRAGVGLIDADRGLKGIFESLKRGRWVGFLADQDARRRGVFVPFLGRPASTPVGPARLAIATRLPIVMGFCVRRPDGRHEIEIEAPIAPPARGSPGAVEHLTALHTARLEAWVRRRPESWFWLHRRWKTAP